MILLMATISLVYIFCLGSTLIVWREYSFTKSLIKQWRTPPTGDLITDLMGVIIGTVILTSVMKWIKSDFPFITDEIQAQIENWMQ